MAGEFSCDPGAILEAQGVRNRSERSRLLRGSRSVTATWHEFQELRLRLHRSWRVWAAVPRFTGPAPLLRFSPRPLYAFERTAVGVRRMVHCPEIAGAAGGMWLRCRTEELPEATVLHVEGEIDLAAAPDFANAVDAALNGKRRLIVDLSRLDYLDGAGIRVLTTAAESDGQPRIVVVGSKPEIHRLFDILELNDVFPVVASVDAARDYLRTQ